MGRQQTFAPLVAALDRVADEGRSARFWLRDDDATAPHPALDRLLDLTERHHVPVTLAVIPAHTGPELAGHMADMAHVAVAAHGWSHANHAPPSEKKQELGNHRPASAVLTELGEGFARLTSLYGSQFLPMLVPPWNRIDEAVVRGLPGLGFKMVSTFGPPRPAPLAVLNSTVDLIDWHGTRGCRDPMALVGDIALGLAAASRPVGLLTHHLVHDAACWEFLEALFDLTAAHSAVRWAAAGELAEDWD